MIGRRRTFALVLAMAVTSCVIGWASHNSATPQQTPPVKPANSTMLARQLCTLEDERINESSGIAASRLYPGLLWTHNDSGDTARLFLITTTGKTVAEVGLQNAGAEDWEDMAIAGTGTDVWIYVGDTGDNGSKRANVVIYRFREPTLDTQLLQQSLTLDAEQMTLTYPDGAHDAETLIATSDERLLIVTKNLTGRSTLFITPQPFTAGKSQVLKQIGTYAFGAGGGFLAWLERLTTGGDLSSDGKHLVVCTYKHAYEWALPQGKSLEEIWKTKPLISQMPSTNQGEAICYSLDGKVLYSSSEKLPAPLFELTPQRQ